MKKCLFTIWGLYYVVGLMAQWSDDPLVNNPLTQEKVGIYHFDYDVTKDGLTYVVFNRPINGNIATVLQIVDKDGVKKCEGDGQVISNEETWTWTVVGRLVFADKAGNALLPVWDCRNSTTEEVSYTVYKISPEGEQLWGENGIDVDRGVAYGLESKINIIQLEDSSYVFSWVRDVIGNGIYRIQMQRVSQDGELLEYFELQESGVKYDHPYLANAGNNQFILVYVRGTILLAQKYDFDMTPLWEEPARIHSAGFPGIPLQDVLRVQPDPQGGVFVGWYDDRDRDNTESVYVAHVTPNGNLGFTGAEGGEKVSLNSYRNFRPQLAYNEINNCLYVIWNAANSAQTYQRLLIQKIARSGEFLWDLEGVLIQEATSEPIVNYSIRSAGDQIAAFYLLQHGNANMTAIASLIDRNGNFVWPNEKVEFSSSVSRKIKLNSSPLIADSYWLTVWGDNRDDISYDNPPLYMQKVNHDATLGGSPTAIRIADRQKTETFGVRPSYVEEAALFVFENPVAGTVDISIYSTSGQKVATVYNGKAAQGAQNIQWNKPATLSKGVYLVRLTDAGGFIQTSRIIIH
jgi:hypothetical protein